MKKPPALLSILRGIHALGLAIALATFGAVGPLALSLSGIPLALVWLVASLTIPLQPHVAPTYRFSVLAAGTLVAFALVQCVPIAGFLPGTASAATGAISVSPSETLIATARFVIFFAALSGGLLLYQTPRHAMSLLRWLSIISAGLIGLALAQFMIAPDRLILVPKLAYKDSFTSVFVNRNTSATFCGMVAVMALALALRDLKLHGTRLDFDATRATSRSPFQWLTWLAFAIAATGLALSRSRAGIVSSVIGMAVVFVLHMVPWIRRSGLERRTIASVLIVALIGLAGAAAILGQVAVRLEDQGADSARWCVYHSIVPAITQRPLFGSGLGTFESLYPLYRDTACGLQGEWEYLHSAIIEAVQSGGIVLVIWGIACSAYLIRILGRGYRHRRVMRAAPTMGLGIIAILALHSLVDFSIQISGIAIYVGVIFGGILPVCTADKSGKLSSF